MVMILFYELLNSIASFKKSISKKSTLANGCGTWNKRKYILNIQKKTAHTSPCPNYDLIIALLDIEIEMCAFYISEQDRKPEKEPCNKRSKNVHWTDQLSDLVEFAYGIVAKRSVDEGRALLKDIIKTLEEAFNVNLSNYTHIFYAIRNRQGDRAVYLKELHDALNAKMDSMDK